jgi:type I restriction enzyme S subunit
MSEVPVGYKRSEVGIVPIEWEERQFNDIVFDFRGGAPLTPNDFKDDGIKVLPKGGVTRGGILVIEKDKIQYCSSQYAENHKTNFVDNTYTIIVLRDLVPSGPNIGLMVKIDSNDNFILAQGVYGFKAKDELVSSHFLIHLSNGTEYRKLMNNIMVGSTQVHITNTTFLKLQIPLPPHPEQQAIASALSGVDALITALEQLIIKKRNIKQGAMQQLLTGKKRLTGFGGAWEVKKLGEIFKITAGGDFKEQFSSNDEDERHRYPIYSNSISNKGLYGFSSYFVYDTNSITVTARGTLGVANLRNRKFVAIGRVLVLQPEYPVDCFFISEFINNRIDFVVESTGVPQLTAPQISLYEISLPSLSEQQAIAQILSDMDTELEALEQKRNKYKAIKQGMMQELLTGKRRLA